MENERENQGGPAILYRHKRRFAFRTLDHKSYRLCMFNLLGLKETICSNAGRPCGCGLDPSLSCTNHTHSWLLKEPVGRKQLARRHEDQETIR
jgi:hypothetical protein